MASVAVLLLLAPNVVTQLNALAPVATAASPSYTVKVSTNAASYTGVQTVSISGTVSPAPSYTGTAVAITVTAPDGKQVIVTQALVSTDGSFSSRFVTGGTIDWTSGTYTLVASYYGSTGTTTFQWGPTQPKVSWPVISSVSPITTQTTATVTVIGSGFGGSPLTSLISDGSVDTIASQVAPSIAIHDDGKGTDSWSAGHETQTNVDAIGVYLVSWTDSQIVLQGFGKALHSGNSQSAWNIAVGDPITILVYGPNNQGVAVFETAVQPSSVGSVPAVSITSLSAFVMSNPSTISLTTELPSAHPISCNCTFILSKTTNQTYNAPDSSLVISQGSENASAAVRLAFVKVGTNYNMSIVYSFVYSSTLEAYVGSAFAEYESSSGSSLNLSNHFLLNYSSSISNQIAGLSSGLMSVGNTYIQSTNPSLAMTGMSFVTLAGGFAEMNALMPSPVGSYQVAKSIGIAIDPLTLPKFTEPECEGLVTGGETLAELYFEPEVTIPQMAAHTIELAAPNNVLCSWLTFSPTVSFQTSGINFLETKGNVVSVDGVTYGYSELLLGFVRFDWAAGTTHTISWLSPDCGTGCRYEWDSSSGFFTSSSGTLTVPPTSGQGPAVITATFSKQYLLTLQISPTGAGTINAPLNYPPVGSGWFASGTTTKLSASAATGYQFSMWIGSGDGSYTGSNNPSQITINGPITETTNFSPISLLQVTTITISADPRSITESPPQSSTIMATVYDQNGNTMSGVQVSFTTTAGIISEFGITNSQGQAQATLTPNQSTQSSVTATVTASVGSVRSPSITVTLLPPQPTTGSLAITISGIPSSSSAQVSVSGPNGYSALPTITGGQTTTLTNLTPGTYTVAGGLTAGYRPAQGSYQVSIVAGQTATLTVQYQQVSIVTTITLSANPTSVSESPSQSSTITATVYDQNGNPMSGVQVSFISTAGIISPSGTTNNQGQAQATLTPNLSTMSPLTVTITASVGNVQKTTTVTFLPPTQFTLTFNESGLPSSPGFCPTFWACVPSWSVTINGQIQPSTTTSLSFREPDGYYLYSVTAPSGYYASPSSSSVSVNGNDVTITIVFATLPTVTFTETGLQGTWGVCATPWNCLPSWSVTLNGNPQSSTSTSISFSIAPGSYTFSVTPPAGYTAHPSSSSVNVTSQGASVTITFSTP